MLRLLCRPIFDFEIIDYSLSMRYFYRCIDIEKKYIEHIEIIDPSLAASGSYVVTNLDLEPI